MTWQILCIVALTGLVGAVGVCVWLAAERRALRAERERLTDDLKFANEKTESLQQAHADLDKQLIKANTQLQGLDEKFQAQANQALSKLSEQFLQLAEQKFKGEAGQWRQSIDGLVKPIREALDKHAKAVGEIEKDRKQDQGSLRQQLASMIDVQRRLGEQTTALTTALKGSATARGRWGEITLRRIVEMAGMSAYCDFDEQVTIWNGDDKLRPDMVVNLPSSRSIVIDAKAVGENYFQAMEATDPKERKHLLHKHAGDLKSRVIELSRKSYTQSLTRAPDFVVLFVPGESFLTAALDVESGLAESAMNNGVVIATPAILISLLRVVEMGWRETRMAENARRISDLGRELHERIAVATGHVDKLGANLGRAVKAYNDFVGSFESRVVASARKFKDLGADSAKELSADPAPQIEVVPREVRQVTSE